MGEQAGTAIADRVSVCRSGEGEAWWAMGSLFERLVGAEQTGGDLAAMVVSQPPGLATPMHVHTRESEAWFVLDGSVLYRAGDELVSLTAGDFIYLPRNIPHAFRVSGERPVRYLAISLPGALLDIYRDLGVPAAERRLPDGGLAAADVEAWNRLAPSYGLRVVGPPIPPGPPSAGGGPLP